MVTRLNWLHLKRKASRREGNQLDPARIGRLVKIADLSAPGSLKSSRHCLFPIINTYSLSLSLSTSLSFFLLFYSLVFLLSISWACSNSCKTIAVDQKRNVLDEPIQKAVRVRDYYLLRLCLDSFYDSFRFLFCAVQRSGKSSYNLSKVPVRGYFRYGVIFIRT